jgi:DNA-binding NtrC family response regulator
VSSGSDYARELEELARPGTIKEVEDSVLLEQLDAAMDERGLDPLEQRIVHALLVHNVTRSDLAEALGLSRPALYRRLDHIGDSLRDFLSD